MLNRLRYGILGFSLFLALPTASYADLEVIEQFAEINTGLREGLQEVNPGFQISDSTFFSEFAQIDSETLGASSYELQTAIIVTRGDEEIRVQGDTAFTAAASGVSGSSATVLGEFSMLFEVKDTPTPFAFDATLNLASGGPGFGGRFAATLDQVVGLDGTRLIDFARLCAPGSGKESGPGTGDPGGFDIAFSCGESSHSKDLVLQPGIYSFRVSESVEKTTLGETGSVVSTWTMSVGGAVDCDLTWNVGDGAMDVAANWSPQRAPSDSGDGCDNLLFDRPGNYVVTMGTLSANSLRLTTGLPIFTGTRLNLGGLGGHPALSVGDDGLLLLTSGRLDFPSGGSILIGRGGSKGDATGALSLQDAAASVTQSASGLATIGANQAGSLSVSSGASMAAGSLVVGDGAPGDVTVSGGSGSARSTLAVSNDATIGKGAAGSLTVTEGAEFGSFGTLFVGLFGPGSAAVHTRDGLDNPATITAESVLVGGPGGESLLTVGVGGRLDGGELFVGTVTGEGAGFIEGASAGKAVVSEAVAAITGDVGVGGVAEGLLRLTGSALLQAGTPGEGHAFRVGFTGNQPGVVQMEGFPGETPRLEIAGDLSLGTDGAASVAVSSGLVSATGAMTLSRGDIAIAAKAEDAFRSRLAVEGGALIEGPGDGADTTVELTASALDVKPNLDFVNGRVTASGFLNESLVDPNAPLEDSAALVKVGDLLTVGTIDPTVQGDARLRLLNGAAADVGELRIRSGEVALLTPETVARPTTLQSFFAITVGNAPETSGRVGVLRILGESFVEAPEGILVKGTGRVFFTRGAVFPRPRVEAGGKVERLRGSGFKGLGGAPVMEGGLILEAGGVLVINAEAGETANLVIDGDAELAGDLEVTFPNEKALQAGSVFNLLQIIGSKIGDFGAVRFPTRSEDFEGAVTFENGELVLEVVNPGVAVIAPGSTDVNGDNSVDAVDVQLVINAALGNDVNPVFITDANGDGSVNAVDIQLVINAALGLS